MAAQEKTGRKQSDDDTTQSGGTMTEAPGAKPSRKRTDIANDATSESAASERLQTHDLTPYQAAMEQLEQINKENPSAKGSRSSCARYPGRFLRCAIEQPASVPG